MKYYNKINKDLLTYNDESHEIDHYFECTEDRLKSAIDEGYEYDPELLNKIKSIINELEGNDKGYYIGSDSGWKLWKDWNGNVMLMQAITYHESIKFHTELPKDYEDNYYCSAKDFKEWMINVISL